MPQGDGPAIDVDLVPVPAIVCQQFAVAQALGGERLVKLEEVIVAQLRFIRLRRAKTGAVKILSGSTAP